ncbi:MAG: hypothetical protein GF372_15155 [Candidatus Marinimicrobia bacterium]|jgi:hypothetical protein|nr:hypothetical protein [Candidatus Neomarinimicrobiota bacterium]
MSEEKDLLKMLETELEKRDSSSLTSFDEVDDFILLTPETLLRIETYKYLDDDIVRSLISEYKTERTIASA